MSLKNFQERLFDLADNIERTWSLDNFEDDLFPNIAFNYLSTFQESFNFHPVSLMDEIQNIELPLQNFLRGEFSDFPLTLIRREKFLIDMYVWMRSDTGIHNHHFSGAFKVICGSSFQITYEFKPHKLLSKYFEEGELIRKEESHLPTGSVQKILYQNNFIHQVLHLEHPTITLCVRTPPSKENALAVYLYPKYRLLLKELDVKKLKWLQALSLALNTENKISDEIPLSECELLQLIYQNNIQPGFLSPATQAFFTNCLKSKNFAPDFLELIKKQDLLSTKLKKFALITNNSKKES